MGKQQLLLVEDDMADLELAKYVLARLGAEVELRVIRDGEAALAFVADATASDLPDLLILDLNLPRVHGQEVLQALRQRALFDDVRIIVMSCSTREKDRILAESHGVEFRQKPFDIDTYEQLMAELLALEMT